MLRGFQNTIPPYFMLPRQLIIFKKKQISSENTTSVLTNFTRTKFQLTLTLFSLLKTLPPTTARPPPTNHHRHSPLVFDEPPPFFSCSLSLHFLRCRTAQPPKEVSFSLSLSFSPFRLPWNVMRRQGSLMEYKSDETSHDSSLYVFFFV
jgi:hypothetical protein